MDHLIRAALIERAQAPLFDGMGDYHRPITTDDEGEAE